MQPGLWSSPFVSHKAVRYHWRDRWRDSSADDLSQRCALRGRFDCGCRTVWKSCSTSVLVVLPLQHTNLERDSSVTVPKRIRGDHWVCPSPSIMESGSGLWASCMETQVALVWVLQSVGDIVQIHLPGSLWGFVWKNLWGFLCSICYITAMQ